MKKIFLGIILAMGMAASAQAHSLWINVFESHAHQPPHALVSLGWGHVLPSTPQAAGSPWTGSK